MAPAISTSRGKRWCFTLNNWTDDDIQYLNANDSNNDLNTAAQCLVYQREIAPDTGTPHLQGMCIFHEKKRFATVKGLLGNRCHLELMSKHPANSLAYCTKTDTRVEGTEPFIFGEIPEQEPGKRNDIEAFKDDVKDGLTDWKELCERHSSFTARAENWCLRYIEMNRVHHPVSDFPLRPFQQALSEYLKNDPTTEPYNRQILFIIDLIGNSGKTHFARWYRQKYHEEEKEGTDDGKKHFIQIQEPGKKADMAQAVSPDTTTIFVNVTRQQVATLQYSTLESYKDADIFAPKYQSHTKRLSPMHVVVLMNQMPDFKHLSRDRYVVWKLESGYKHTELSRDEIATLCDLAREEEEEEAELKRLERKRNLRYLRNKALYPPFRDEEYRGD